ncbi:hypothetical protein DSECCO2_550990 [anaerobic digester metagenome]
MKVNHRFFGIHRNLLRKLLSDKLQIVFSVVFISIGFGRIGLHGFGQRRNFIFDLIRIGRMSGQLFLQRSNADHECLRCGLIKRRLYQILLFVAGRNLVRSIADLNILIVVVRYILVVNVSNILIIIVVNILIVVISNILVVVVSYILITDI